MRKAEVNIMALYGVLMSAAGIIVNFVAPQVAGLLGGVMYLIVRHESKTANFTLRSLLIVSLMGYTGSWVVMGLVPIYYEDTPEKLLQTFSFITGFMMYDFYMMWGQNTKSVIGVVFSSLKELAIKYADKKVK